MTHRCAVALAAVLVAVAPCRWAAAQPSAQDSAVAQSLYDQGRKLMADGKFSDACPKLEESDRLDPTPVTQFWLADCYERVGRTASAWSSFLDLAATARKNGGPKAEEREKVARDRASALQPKLTQLVIDVPPAARVAGLVVRRDGEAVRDGQWGTPIPVDPGSHTFEASAPGKQTWSKTQTVEGAGQTVTLRVEALADVPVAAAPSAAPEPASAKQASASPNTAPSPSAAPSPLKTAGLVAAGVGIVGVGLGTVFGIQALAKNSDANNGHCGGSLGGPNDCDAAGVQLRRDAVGAGNLSTVGFVAGGLLLAGGAALWFLTPSGVVQAGPAVGSGGAGIELAGTF